VRYPLYYGPAVLSGRRPAIAFTVLVAILCWLEAPHALLGSDQMFHLVWGSDLRHGRAPHLHDVHLPLPHPLELALAVPESALGRLGEDIVRALALLSLPAAAVAVYQIGRRLVSAPVGLLAAALLVTRPHLVELAQHGDVDIPALALLAWAAALGLERPAGDTAVLLLLAAAGLLRPEPWLFAVLYAAWAARRVQWRRRVRLAALALLGPVLWALHDWVVAGEPLWSFTHTHANAVVVGNTGLGQAARLLPHHLGYLVALPSLIVGVLGLAAGVRLAPRESLAIGAVGAVFLGGFLFYGASGLTLSPRYLVVLAAVISLFAAIGALGWTALAPGERGPWRAAGMAGLAVLAIGVPWDVAKHAAVRTALLDDGALLEPLVRRDADALRRCRPVELTAIRALPYVAYWTGIPIDGFTLAPARSLVTPTASTVSDLANRPPTVAPAPAALRPAAADRAWRIYTACSGT
jgi:hypothetical protein